MSHSLLILLARMKAGSAVLNDGTVFVRPRLLRYSLIVLSPIFGAYISSCLYVFIFTAANSHCLSHPWQCVFMLDVCSCSGGGVKLKQSWAAVLACESATDALLYVCDRRLFTFLLW